MAGEGDGVGVVEDQGGGQGEPGERGESLAQFHRGQRVEAGVPEGAFGGHALGGGVAEDDGGLGAHQIEQQPLLLLGGEAAEPAGQLGGRAGGARGGGGAQGGDGVDRVEQAAGAGGGEDGVVLLPVDVGDGDGALAAYDGAAQLGHGGVRPQEPQSGALDALGDRAVGAGHADLGPGAPGDGGGGEAAGAAVLGECVEVGVGGGVGALSRAAPHAGDGGDQDEEVQVAVAEQGVEVGGAEGLGGHRRGDLVQRGGGQRRGLADAGRVHHTGEGRVVGYAVEHRGQRAAVGGVAGDEGDPGAEFLQFGAEFDGAGGFAAAAAGEDQVGGAGTGQPAGGLGTEAAGAAGDQDGAGGRELVLAGQVVARVAYDAAGEGAVGAHGELVLALVGGEDAHQALDGRGVEDLRQVDQAAPLLGPLQGGCPAQAPGGGPGGVGQGVAGAGGDGAAGHRPQRGGDAGVAQGLGEDDAEGEAGGQPVFGVGRVAERQQGEDAADAGTAVGGRGLDGGAQGLGEAVAVEVGLVQDEASDDGSVAAQGVEDLRGLVGG